MDTIETFLFSLIGLLMMLGALYEALTVTSPLYMLGMGFMGLFMIILPMLINSLSE